MKATRRLFIVHSWLGLVTGLFLLLLGLSGSILVFRHELDRLANHTLLTVSPPSVSPGSSRTPGNQAVGQPLAHCYQTITRRYPNLDGIAWLNPNAGPNEAYDFRLYQNDVRLLTYDLGLISFNPYTGAILREGKSSEFRPSLIEWLLQFHFSFQAGVPGAALTALFGLTMLGSLLTGLVVYRKMIWNVITFRFRINRKNWRTISSDLHRVVGMWSLGLNAIIFFTGFWMNLFAFKAKTWQTELIPTRPNSPMVVSADTLYRQALLAIPDIRPSYVYLPTQPERKFSVRGYLPDQWVFWGAANSVSIDQYTGQLLTVRRLSDLSAGERIEATFFPLHVGNYGGLPVKILYVLIGLTPGLLSVTGFLLWWRRARKTPASSSRRALAGKLAR